MFPEIICLLHPLGHVASLPEILVLEIILEAPTRDKHDMSQCMRFPTMWYVRPAEPQISLRICAV